MSFLNTFNISASGMTAQRLRLDVASENIANVKTTRTADGGPYRRKVVELTADDRSFAAVYRGRLAADRVFSHGRGVKATAIMQDPTELKAVYEPDHPDADAEGYIRVPNIDMVKEITDSMAASRTYEANITAFNASKLMAQKALEIGR